MTPTAPATEIRPEINPSKGRVEFAVYIDGAHCGYAGSNLAGATLRDEILAKRAEAAEPRCSSCGDPISSPEGELCDACYLVFQDHKKFGIVGPHTPGQGAEGAEGAELAHQERAALVAEARQPAPKRRRKAASPCTCPQCQPAPDANGVYRCRAGQEWVAFHAGLYIASGPNFLQINDKLNDYRRTLLKRPLPDATPEEVESVLAADQ